MGKNKVFKFAMNVNLAKAFRLRFKKYQGALLVFITSFIFLSLSLSPFI